MKCPIAQVVEVLVSTKPKEPKPKVKHKDRHPPGYMAAYMRRRRMRGMFVELGL